MPFDCAPIIDAPKSLPALDGDVLDFGTESPKADVIIARPIPAWHASRRPECVGDTLAVLASARALLADERRWCRDHLLVAGGSFLSWSGRCSRADTAR